jgi:putative RNA 2'-phosphotransferase
MDFTKKGKFLALILRHNPDVINIKLDEKGWADVSAIVKNSDFTIKELEILVKTDDKGRYEFNENKTKIRACQGHSIEVELDLIICTPPEILYHGTKENVKSLIFKKGLQKMDRQYVHLTDDINVAIETANRRKGESVILEIKALEMDNAGFVFYKSNNGVYLIKEVPPRFISVK